MKQDSFLLSTMHHIYSGYKKSYPTKSISVDFYEYEYSEYVYVSSRNIIAS